MKQGLTHPTEEQGKFAGLGSGILPVDGMKWNGEVFGEEEGGGMHIVGMHAHAAHHRHNHPHGQDACEGNIREPLNPNGHGHSHGHSHGDGGGEEDSGLRHVVVSQVRP